MSTDCDEMRDVTTELALGIASGDERARVLDHVAGCPACRRDLERLAAIADDMLVLAPEGEPPPGFEARVLRAMTARPPKRRWFPRRLALPAVGLAGAALASAVLLVSFNDDRQLATQYRQALSAAHGSAFAAVPLRDTARSAHGSVSLYKGSPSWLVVTVDGAARKRIASAEIVSRSGRRVTLRAFRLTAGVWGGALPIPFDQVASVQLLGDQGSSVLAAYTMGRW
jgi:predicted anti-sigma-YlaC factor YlaD